MLKLCSIALILLKMKSGVIMVIIGFTYLHHPEQPLAHSSVSSYQRLYSPASNKVHTRTSSLSATIAAAGTGWDRGAQQLGQTTGIPAFQIQ